MKKKSALRAEVVISINIIAMGKKKSALRTEGIISMDIMTLGNVTNTNMKAHLYSICDQDM